MRYLIKTPNREYTGKTMGVQFVNGQAIVDATSLDPNLEWTLDEVIYNLENVFGYKVKAMDKKEPGNTETPAEGGAPKKAAKRGRPKSKTTEKPTEVQHVT